MQAITDFGMVDLTGATDSAAAIQAAIDSCNGILLWPSGVVRIDATLRINRPIRIIGPGIDQKRVGGWVPEGCGASLLSYDPSIPYFRINANNVIIEGLALTGTGARFLDASGGAGIVVGDEPIGGFDSTVTGVRLRDVSTSAQRVGVHFVRASDWVMDGCDIHGYQGVIVENRANVDKGAAVIRDCFFAAHPTEGICLTYKSGGSLRINGTYFLECRDSMYIEWLSGLSGGPIITGCSFENMTRRGINAVGNGVAPMNGMQVSDCFFNGAMESIFIDDNIPLSKLHIKGNTIVGGSTTILVNLGAMVSEYYVTGNLLDGSGAGYGIFRRGFLPGLIGENSYNNLLLSIV